MVETITIQESFTLPSKGKLYNVEFNPTVTLRSMTTAEEMKRLSYSESEYKVMADIIDDCIIEKLPISAYDMCLGDYQFLLHKLRVVTYGPEYKMAIQCPNCNEVTFSSVDLDTIAVHEYDEEVINKERELILPLSKKKIQLSFQTPRMLDAVKEKAKERKKKAKSAPLNYEILFTAMSLISKVDGVTMDDITLEDFVKKLPLRELSLIIQEGDKLNREVGLDTSVIAKCHNCGYEVITQFRIQSEFFGPEVQR